MLIITVMLSMDNGSKVVSYSTVRSEIRIFNIEKINNLFRSRIPNLLILEMVASAAFNGEVNRDLFFFQKFSLSSIKQLVRGG